MVAWKQLARLSDHDLAMQDIAEVNLACAVGLPGTDRMDVAGCLQTVDDWARLVQRETDRLYPQFRRRPEAFSNSTAYFRVLAMVTVLQRDLGAMYDPATNELEDAEFFKRPELLFVYGPLGGPYGTCCSLPPLYVAVGRRLGYPLRLVSTFQHLFARWDGEGERFNIECAARGLNCYGDDHYKQWPKQLTGEQQARFGTLHSMSPRPQLAYFLSARGHCWLAHGQMGNAAEAYAHASDLEPNNEAMSSCLVDTLQRWKRDLHSRHPPRIGLPPMTVRFPARQFPNVPVGVESELFHLRARQHVLDQPEYDARWWHPLRQDPTAKPAGLPAFIEYLYGASPDEPPEIRLLDRPPTVKPSRFASRPIFSMNSQAS